MIQHLRHAQEQNPKPRPLRTLRFGFKALEIPCGGWQHVRGWVSPQNVTAHYWTAAELLALQIAMLTDVDQRGSRPALLIGAGVPQEWLNSSMSVAHVPTPLGVVDWTWQNKALRVCVRHAATDFDVRLGAAFPPETSLELEKDFNDNQL